MDYLLHRKEAMTAEEQAGKDMGDWWPITAISLNALKLIVKNPLYKSIIQLVLNIGNAIYLKQIKAE